MADANRWLQGGCVMSELVEKMKHDFPCRSLDRR